MICLRAFFILLILSASANICSGLTDQNEVSALKAIYGAVGDVFNRLSNWAGDDPCGSGWTGVICETINGVDHVTELRLLNMNLTGSIAPDVGNLTELVILDFMWNNITGSIPPEIGNLSKLYLLLLNGNKLTGQLPPELGNLSQLNRFQIDQNNISGPIPSTFQFLNNANHFHMNNNSLNGSIPPELGRLENLIHLLLDNNDLSGQLPPELSNISTLLIMQLDNNHFNGSIPSNYSQLKNLTKLLRNCNLTGIIPDVSGMSNLAYLDLSSNQLTGQLPASISQTITTLDLAYNQLDGDIPDALYKLRGLELLLLRNNLLDGTFNGSIMEHDSFVNASSVLILDIQNNNITGYESGALLNLPNVTLKLFGNPVCNDSSPGGNVCTEYNGSILNLSLPNTATSPSLQCSSELTCDPSRNFELVYGLSLLYGQCHCAYPLNIGYRLKSPGFAIFPPYEDGFIVYLSSGLNLSVYQVNVSSYNWEPGPRLNMNINLFPKNTTNEFTEAEVDNLFNTFSTWSIPDNDTFGPYEVLFLNRDFPYNGTLSSGTTSSLSGGAIAGIIISVIIFTAVLVAVIMVLIAKRQQRYTRARRHYERIKVAGVKDFTYEEMAKATNNFDKSTEVGQGGYGKVYRGTLADGTVVAIKRAQEGSLQGTREFCNEIELLSRVHHRNLVSLIGFCDDEDEQMLVYEYMENGTVRDHLNSNSKQPLNFATRIQIALGSARGIHYLHTEANPPIYHRDIKASNILLDSYRRAKVADFGLSRLAPVAELEGDTGGDVSTVVKGTPVNLAYEAGMLLSIVDHRMGPYPAECLRPLISMAISCCQDDTNSRPSMSEVVRELEAIWSLIPDKNTMVSLETSISTDSGVNYSKDLVYNNLLVSSDVSGRALMTNSIPEVSPR
ncbi:hypothetical protein KP509_05G061100 [Ceratopteris richardii]|uniref:Protein kinase domain-containing protein n=1 Tax=Ceratopteris richardii TaxID=49495 RepID=A0A8T2UM53_CERRI|nr:hypothetical protein KP509_05G061100 [Ceratopteris richardii]